MQCLFQRYFTEMQILSCVCDLLLDVSRVGISTVDNYRRKGQGFFLMGNGNELKLKERNASEVIVMMVVNDMLDVSFESE